MVKGIVFRASYTLAGPTDFTHTWVGTTTFRVIRSCWLEKPMTEPQGVMPMWHRVEFRTTEWELADSSLEVGRGLGDIVGSSPRAHQRFVGKFVDGSPICCRELTRNSPEGCWEFVEGNQELIGRMPGVRREIS
ncbi:hypothetical protein BHE74_00050632 [Ensete ventricosum]|nr:hypothetical protein BHE74_00050632 [Ensete ventricosum]